MFLVDPHCLVEGKTFWVLGLLWVAPMALLADISVSGALG